MSVNTRVSMLASLAVVAEPATGSPPASAEGCK